MPNACRVPTSGSDAGKYSFAKTSPVTVLYRKKSYHSIVVPIVLAITARRNWTPCSRSESGSVAIPAAVIEPSPKSERRLHCGSRPNVLSRYGIMRGSRARSNPGEVCGRALAGDPEQEHCEPHSEPGQRRREAM